MEFRPVNVAEVGPAHALYLSVVDWLRAKNIRMWLRPASAEEFAERQTRNELFAGFLNGHMAATVSLAFEEDADWLQHVGKNKHWWIKTLAVARAYQGRELGTSVLEKCESFVANTGAREVYLECIDAGYLPDYYTRLGYEVLVRTSITYPSGNTFLMALMRKTLR